MCSDNVRTDEFRTLNAIPRIDIKTTKTVIAHCCWRGKETKVLTRHEALDVVHELPDGGPRRKVGQELHTQRLRTTNV